MTDPSAPVEARPVLLQEVATEGGQGAPLFQGRMDLIQGVRLRLSTLVGSAEISVAELFALQAGSVLALDRRTDQPVELYLGDKLVACGELVVVDDSFGVRITRVGPAEA